MQNTVCCGRLCRVHRALLKDGSFAAFLVAQFLGAFNDNVYKTMVSLTAVKFAVDQQAGAIIPRNRKRCVRAAVLTLRRPCWPDCRPLQQDKSAASYEIFRDRYHAGGPGRTRHPPR